MAFDMKDEGILNQKEKELVYLSASVASGCQPCTEYHIGKSREAGFTENEIHEILLMALSVRDMATRNMESFILNKKVDGEIGITGNLNRDDILIGLAAGYSVNYKSGFARYAKMGQKIGIGDHELYEIIKMSGAVADKARSLLLPANSEKPD
jgi:AhpD family alkylhydroperoxidase